jgi:UDP-3-O-[3-hydroxymyristoyl] N-acetylglucosamine deacetylase
MNQKTIKSDIFFEGIGVHSGTRSTVTLRPAEANAGIVLLNKNFSDHPIIIGACIPEQAMHATVIKNTKWAVSTVEHLFAALSGLEIDNISVEIEGPEVPIMDGSALPFVQAIKTTGIVEQEGHKQYLTPKEKLIIAEDGRYMEISPALDYSPLLTFDYTVEFEHPLIEGNRLEGIFSPSFFIDEIAPARTFGFLEQLPFLRKHGLAKGTTLGNTVVVGDNMFLNNRRFPDEFIRHKFLDLIGDLALLGKNLAGTIKAHKTGHNFNRKVVEHWITHPDKWMVF